MKIYDTITLRCSTYQDQEKKTLRFNKIILTGALFAFAFFPTWENNFQKTTGKSLQLVSSVYGMQFSVQESSPPLGEQTSVSKTEPAPGEETRIANSATCGRPWEKQLRQVQGKIRDVEYRAQPITGRKGLHIDVETGVGKYTTVHVYPETLIGKCPSVFQFTVGDTVTVSGSEFFTGPGRVQQNICAAVIRQPGRTLGVRDPVTGTLDRQLCCQAICEKNCTGLPPMCDRMCMGNCKNQWIKAALQGTRFCPSCDNEYAATPSTFEP